MPYTLSVPYPCIPDPSLHPPYALPLMPFPQVTTTLAYIISVLDGAPQPLEQWGVWVGRVWVSRVKVGRV